MRGWFVAAALVLCGPASGFGDHPCATVVLVVGADGTEEYGKQFRHWANLWQDASRRANLSLARIGLEPAASVSDRDALRQRIADDSQDSTSPYWLILIGHGTFDGRTARFNLRGPDVSAKELADWLRPMQRPIAVINCASSSAPFLKELSGENRVVVSATKSGAETNFARMGGFLAEAVTDLRADLDKDEQVSLLEAFLSASSRTKEFYTKEARLATEHALLDDNGDQLGTPADWFRGVRAVKVAKDGTQPDGTRAHQLHLITSDREDRLSAEQRMRRDELEQSLEKLRQQKNQFTETEYLNQIEPVLLELASIYEQAG